MRAPPYLIAAVLAWTGCGGGEVSLFDARSGIVRPQAIEVPMGDGAQTPTLSHGGGGVLLSVLRTKNEVPRLEAVRLDGTQWSEPVTIHHGDDLLVNWADFPRVQALGDGFAAHWLRMNPNGDFAYDAVFATADGWDAPWRVVGPLHGDGAAAEHGFVTHLPEPDGAHTMAWLDGRNMADGKGTMALMARTWRNGSLEAERVLDDDVCTCCQTDGAWAGDIPVVVYRDHTPDEIRDIAVARRVNGRWTAGTRVAADDWHIAGCPVNGPAVTAQDRDVAVAWFSGAELPGKVSLAWSTDSGASFEAPIRLDGGAPLGRVDITHIGDGEVVALWVESESDASETAHILARRVSRDGTAGPPKRLAETTVGRSAGFPSMLLDGHRLLVTWTDASGSTPRVRMAVVPAATL